MTTPAGVSNDTPAPRPGRARILVQVRDKYGLTVAKAHAYGARRPVDSPAVIAALCLPEGSTLYLHPRSSGNNFTLNGIAQVPDGGWLALQVSCQKPDDTTYEIAPHNTPAFLGTNRREQELTDAYKASDLAGLIGVFGRWDMFAPLTALAFDILAVRQPERWRDEAVLYAIAYPDNAAFVAELSEL